MARLRKAAGYSQRQLAEELGVSARMIAYYEARALRPPAHLLGDLARLLGVTTDQLLGCEERPMKISLHRSRLMSKLLRAAELPPQAQRVLLECLDALLVKHGVQNGVGGQAARS